MIRGLLENALDRMAASDPGFVRLRVAASAVLGIAVAVAVLLPAGQPLTITLVGAIAAMMAAFTVNDPTPVGQALTLLLGLLAGAVSLTSASLGNDVPPLDGVIFVLLIFVAVYAQRFGPRGVALGSITFFLFFFAMFLGTSLAQVPALLAALAVGIAANALVRFLLLPRRPDRELLRIRRAFRARLATVISTSASYLSGGGNDRTRRQLRKADSRLHECVLLIEDTAEDVIGTRAAGMLRRRAIEVELAVQWLSITTRRTCVEELAPEIRTELVARLRRFRALIERDPRDLPLISDTEEFSRMLVEGSSLRERPQPGDELRRAIAELALADVNAQRVAERDYSVELAESEPVQEPGTSPEREKTRIFAFDNQTRSALQAVVGGGLAVLGGELISPQRWYWAVLTVFVVFLGSSTAGATFVKGARRLGGTIVGIFGGALSALLVGGNQPATIGLILVCVFGMVYVSRVSQTAMAFFVTTMLGLLYSLLGTFSYSVLGVRLAETAVGALAGVLAAVLIVPVRTRAAMLDDLRDVLTGLREFLDRATGLLAGTENVNVIELSRDLDRAVGRLRATVEPLTHPVNLSARRDYGWYVLSGVEAMAFRARHIAARAQPGLLHGQPALYDLAGRIGRNVDTLIEITHDPSSAGGHVLLRATGEPPGETAPEIAQRSVLSSLGRLDIGVLALGPAFDVPVRDTDEPAVTLNRSRST